MAHANNSKLTSSADDERGVDFKTVGAKGGISEKLLQLQSDEQ